MSCNRNHFTIGSCRGAIRGETHLAAAAELEAVLSVGYTTGLFRPGLRSCCGGTRGKASQISLARPGRRNHRVQAGRRYAQGGLAALEDQKPTGRPRSVSGQARARIIALTKVPPPAEPGLTHWSSYAMSRYLKAARGHCRIRQLHRATVARARAQRVHPEDARRSPYTPAHSRPPQPYASDSYGTLPRIASECAATGRGKPGRYRAYAEPPGAVSAFENDHSPAHGPRLGRRPNEGGLHIP